MAGPGVAGWRISTRRSKPVPSVDKRFVHKRFVHKYSVHKRFVHKRFVHKRFVDKRFVDKYSVDKYSVGRTLSASRPLSALYYQRSIRALHWPGPTRFVSRRFLGRFECLLCFFRFR